MKERFNLTDLPEGMLPYDTLLQAADAIAGTILVLCPEPQCERSATIERHADGSARNRFHARGSNDAVAKLLQTLGQVEHHPCPAHSDHFERLLEASGVVVGPDDPRTAKEICQSLNAQHTGR